MCFYCSASQASKDAARYPVAAKVAQLLIRGLVSFLLFFSVKLGYFGTSTGMVCIGLYISFLLSKQY